jgi:hypothetical protein
VREREKACSTTCGKLVSVSQGILGTDAEKKTGKKVSKADAYEFFFAGKGLMTAQQRGRAKDRELDLHQFIQVCKSIAGVRVCVY